jgi:hypothetical protein
MARSEEDILELSFQLEAHVTLDIERVINDPIWRLICLQSGLEDTEYHPELLVDYLNHYIIRDKALTDMPATNGPAELRLLGMN